MKNIQIVMLLIMPYALHVLLGGLQCGSASDSLVWSVLAPVATLCFMANEGKKRAFSDDNTAWPANQVLACVL
jgi:hypothetical protein